MYAPFNQNDVQLSSIRFERVFFLSVVHSATKSEIILLVYLFPSGTHLIKGSLVQYILPHSLQGDVKII